MICRSCGSDRTEMFLDLGDQPHCGAYVAPGDPDPPAYPLRLWFCHDCTLVQIDATIPKETMFGGEYAYVSGTTETLKAHFKDSAVRLSHRYLSPDDFIVDIGSNDGTWLAQYGEDYRILGVEPSQLADVARRSRIPTVRDFFDEVSAEMILQRHGKAKLITAAGVFFHLEDLHSVIKGIETLLADDGVLVIQALYLGSIIETVAFDQVCHEHLCYYTLESLERLLAPYGFKVHDAKLLPIHGGTIEIHARHYKKPTNFMLTVEYMRFHAMESSKGLDSFTKYELFADNVRDRGEAIAQRLAALIMQDKTIYAYGAPAKGATLLNSFGISNRLVQCAIEKNPRKFEKDIPGCRIPIIDEARAEVPDVYLLLAWNFAEEIIAKEQAFLDGGGRFLIPFPKARMVQRS